MSILFAAYLFVAVAAAAFGCRLVIAKQHQRASEEASEMLTAMLLGAFWPVVVVLAPPALLGWWLANIARQRGLV